MSQQPAHDPVKILRFTTQGIVPNSRVQLWEGHNARALIPLDIRTLDQRPMQAAETNLHLPSVRMATVFGSSQIVERTESFISQNPSGVIAIFFATEGEAFFYHRGGHISIKPGQAVVYDADRPFLRGFNHGFRELVLTIPRERYLEMVGPEAPELPVVFDFGPSGRQGEQALARLVHTTLESISAGKTRHPDPSENGTVPLLGVENETLELIQLVLGGAAGSEGGLITAARHHIEFNLNDKNLNPAQVAAAIGVSERQLSRLFAEAGTTVGRYLLQKRLELAHQALISPEQAGLSVGEIGKRFGFASPSHFGRTFRENYGMTPLQCRKEAQRSQLGG